MRATRQENLERVVEVVFVLERDSWEEIGTRALESDQEQGRLGAKYQGNRVEWRRLEEEKKQRRQRDVAAEAS